MERKKKEKRNKEKKRKKGRITTPLNNKKNYNPKVSLLVTLEKRQKKMCIELSPGKREKDQKVQKPQHGFDLDRDNCIKKR